MTDRMIIASLATRFQDAETPLEIFRSVSFVVQRGEIIGVFGPNGCGKSTLLRVLAGLKPSNDGTVEFPKRNDLPTVLSLIPQDYRASFFNWTSLLHNILLTLPSPLGRYRQNVKTILEVQRNLESDINLTLLPGHCSGGMLQQAAIIRAFAVKPDVLLADEPFSALDVNVAQRVRRSFRRVVKELATTALVVLHDVEDLVEVCDRVLVVPGRPFSSEAIEGFHRTRVLRNEFDRTAQREETFAAIVERILAGGSGP